MRGESPDESTDAGAAAAYIVGSIEFMKQCLGKLAGLEIK
jgi:hypothetical protein